MLKNPGKADLDKDGKLSSYEKKRGMAIEKAMSVKPMKAAMGKSVRGYGAARTSGSGLLDEQMAPGKVMGAKRGKFLPPKNPGMGEAKDYKKYLQGLKEATKSKSAKKASDIAMKAAKSTRLGKIALGIAGAGIAAKEYLKRKKEKKMGGGMMNKPMGYKSGTMVMARGCKLGRKKATKIT